MYNDYFGFREAPFSIAPDPRYLFMTEQHREALAHLVYGLNSDGAFILLTGEVGTGKTTVCRCLLNQIPDKANIALVLNPKVTAAELLATVCDELDIVCPEEASIKICVDAINRFLIDSHARGEKTVLIIDEAQHLDKSVLEQLRLLTNLETDRQKLLQIIMLGQPELLDILSSDEMRQLAQRITARFHLKPLSREEIRDYVSHRLAVAGQNVQLFPDAAIRRLYQLSRGIPRLVNILCDRALLGTYVQNRHQVDVKTMEQAAKEVFGEIRNVTRQANRPRWPVMVSVAAALLLGVTLTWLAFTSGKRLSDHDNTAMNIEPADAIASPAASPPSQALPAEPADEPASPENKQSTPSDADRLLAWMAQQGDNATAAWTVLLQLWGQPFDTTQTRSACRYAELTGLRCLHKTGNLNSLRKINRPAILKLYDQHGNAASVTLVALDEHQATIDTGQHRLLIDNDVLDGMWLGEYSLLWQPPPYYQNALTPGNNGPLVQWLDQQLAKLYDSNDPPGIADRYQGRLVERVRQFQLAHALVPDGIAGPLTFIHLNTALGIGTPQLTREQTG